MIEKTIHLCQMNMLLDISRDRKTLAAFILPQITEHHRKYAVRLDCGDGFATISFEPGAIVLDCKGNGYNDCRHIKFYDIKRFTHRRLQYFAQEFATVIDENLHNSGNPNLTNTDLEA